MRPLAIVAELCQDDLPDLLLGSRCVGCAKQGRSWCADCTRTLDRPATRTRPYPAPIGFPPAWTVAVYEDEVRAAVLAHKERGRAGLARPLGGALGRSLQAALEGTPAAERTFAVPVPSSRAAIRVRGYDSLRQLARRATATARRAGYRVRLFPALRQTRRLRDQSGLTAQARGANLAGAFAVPSYLHGQLAGQAVVIVDDVVTTGATATEAARALQAAGATVLGVATVAATQRTTAELGWRHGAALQAGPR